MPPPYRRWVTLAAGDNGVPLDPTDLAQGVYVVAAPGAGVPAGRLVVW